MNTYIALFRGINIGGHHLLPMGELVTLLEKIGLQNIKTYIQSGNVVFQTAKGHRSRLSRVISQKVQENFGFAPKVLLLNEKQLLDAIKHNPFDTLNGKALHFFFMDSVPQAPDQERLAAIKTSTEEFKLDGSVFYLFTPEGVGRSKLAASVEKCLGIPTTARNWNTITKLLAMVRHQDNQGQHGR
jgi:uncharacterized protein (DUF1697 family)